MLDFREHKRVHDALSDVLPWAALIAPEVVLNKDGSFLATIRYRGPDLDSSTEEERVVKVAHINNILKRLGSGWALHAEAQRRVVNSYPEPSFPDPLSYLIDLRRSEAFRSNQHYETRYFLSLIFMPPRERETKLAGKFINSSNEDGINYRRVLEGFRSQVIAGACQGLKIQK
jgi:type IV secretion system protein VirB4